MGWTEKEKGSFKKRVCRVDSICGRRNFKWRRCSKALQCSTTTEFAVLFLSMWGGAVFCYSCFACHRESEGNIAAGKETNRKGNCCHIRTGWGILWFYQFAKLLKKALRFGTGSGRRQRSGILLYAECFGGKQQLSDRLFVFVNTICFRHFANFEGTQWDSKSG